MLPSADCGLVRLRELTDAHHRLRKLLLEITRLSEQQCQVPGDRADALLAIIDRKQQALREISSLDAPGLFGECARAVERTGNEDPETAQAKRHLRAEASANLRLWERVVETEGRARTHCAACMRQLGEQLSSAHRKNVLQRTYTAGDGRAPAFPRFLNDLR